MNIQHLRHSLKIKWLLYYQKNRPWLVQLRIWGTYDGQRRPSSSFILAILANLEPELTQLLPLIVALSNNPDQIVAALGLNFNPDQELKSLNEPTFVAETNANGSEVTVANAVAATNGNKVMAVDNLAKTNGNGVTAANALAETNGDSLITANVTQAETNGNGVLTQTLSILEDDVNLSPTTQASNIPSWVDESCNGRGSPNTGIALSILVLIGSLAVLVIGFSG